MPQWSNAPPETDLAAYHRLLRAPAKGTMTAVILSDDLVGCPVHYARGRTRPCERPHCEHCAEGLTPRWTAYLAVTGIQPGRIDALELTAAAAAPLVRARSTRGTLRGMRLELSRRNNRHNGRIAVSLSIHTDNYDELPPPLDIVAFLTQLWSATPKRTQEPTQQTTPETRAHNQAGPARRTNGRHLAAEIGLLPDERSR